MHLLHACLTKVRMRYKMVRLQTIAHTTANILSSLADTGAIPVVCMPFSVFAHT